MPRGGVLHIYTQASSEETKYFDVCFTQTVASAADWTGTEVPCVNYMTSDGATDGAYTDSALIPSAIGAGYGQVVGSKYHLKKLRVRGEVSGVLQSDQADVPVSANVRLILVHDTSPNGAQAQGEVIINDLGDAFHVNYGFLAMAAGTGGRFRILADEVITLDPAVAGTDGASTNSVSRGSKTFSFMYKPKKPLQVCLKANSSTPTVASLSNHNIFLLAHSTKGSVQINGCARAYYVG